MDPKAKIENGLIDIIIDEILKWAKAEAHTDIPIALNSLRIGLLKVVSSFFDDAPESKLPMGDMNSYLEGRKGGEMSKELAMIAGMIEIGLSKEQINQVVEYSKHAWDPIEKEKSP